MSLAQRLSAGAAAGLLALATVYAPSQDGLDAIKKHEGVRQSAYRDPVGIPTICYGTTKGVVMGQRASLVQCEVYLREDATYAGKAVARHVRVPMTQGQYDALTSFVYNVGPGNFAGSTMLRKINAGDCQGAGAEFPRWVYAKGQKLPGLVKRRQDERAGWDKGCASW